MAVNEMNSSTSCTVPPRVELGVNMKSLIVVKAGENVFLDAEVHGKPLPKVSWKRDGAPLVIAEGMKTTQKKHVHTLELYSVTRKETGDYSILAENLTGSKYATIKVKVLGKLDQKGLTSLKCMQKFNPIFFLLCRQTRASSLSKGRQSVRRPRQTSMGASTCRWRI